VIRVVLDTNVFVSSFFGGNPRKIVDLWKKGSVILCLSPPVVEEYVEVLRRLGLEDSRELEDLLRLFAEGRHILFTGKTPPTTDLSNVPSRFGLPVSFPGTNT